MAARSKKPTGGRRQAIDADAVVAEYAAWLGRQPLAGRSRDAYLVHRARRPVPGRLHVPLVVPHRSVPDAGLHQGRSAAFGAGQPGEEAAHLGHRPWRPSTASTAQSASADRRWPGRSWPGSRPGHWRRPTSGGSCERGRGLPVGAGPGDRHGVLLHRATPLRAGRPRGGRSVGLGPPGSVAGLLGEGRRRPPGGAPQQRLPPRHRRVDHPPGPTRWPPGAATSSPPAASAALWLSRSESRYPQRCASGAGAPAPRPRPQSGSASTTRTAPVAWSSAVCRHRRMHLNQRTSPPHRGGGGRDRGSG